MGDRRDSAPRGPASAPPAGLVLKNGTLARAFPAEVLRADVRILRGQIAELGENLSPLRDEEIVDCTGLAIMPGLVSAHTHLAGSLVAGAGGRDAATPPPDDAACGVPRPLAAALDESSLYASVVAGALDALRRGVTTVVDMSVPAPGVGAPLDVVAHALQEVGLRGVLSLGVHDLDGDDEAARAIEETRGFLARPQRPHLAGLVGGWAPGVLGERTLERLGDLAARHATGTHLHVGEMAADAEHAERHFGLGLTERLLEAGVLMPRTLLAIGGHLSFEELAVAREAGCWFAWSPRSLMARGLDQPAPEHLPPDRTVLGTDTLDIDVLAELEVAWLKMSDLGSGLRPERAAHMVTNAQRLAAQCLGLSLGTLQAGAAADLALFEYDPAVTMNARTLAEHMIVGLRRAPVWGVIVDGRFLLRERRLLAADNALHRAAGRSESVRLRDRMMQTSGVPRPLEKVETGPRSGSGSSS